MTALMTDQRNIPRVSEGTWVPQLESCLLSARRGQSYVETLMFGRVCGGVWGVYAWEPTMWRPEVNIRCFLQSLLTLVLRHHLSLNLELKVPSARLAL